jgi:hypothetical protein
MVAREINRLARSSKDRSVSWSRRKSRSRPVSLSLRTLRLRTFGRPARHETYYGSMVALLPGAGELLISESFSLFVVDPDVASYY